MSFLRTLAALAAGFAAAKGWDKYRELGGMEGVKEALRKTPAVAANPALLKLLDGLGDAAQRGGAAAQAGAARLAGMLGGAAATGAEGVGGMLDALTGTRAATGAMEDQAKLMIRAMIMAAKADGVIDAAERARLEPYLAGLSAEERAFVEAEMAAPVDPVALAREAGAAAGAQVYAAAAGMCRGENPMEAAFLDRLAQGLGLDRAARAEIHARLGLAMPPADAGG